MLIRAALVVPLLAWAMAARGAQVEVLLDGTVTQNMKPHKLKEGDGYLEIQKGKGGLSSSKAYSNYHLHVEWKPPVPARGSSQGRGNSGVFMGRYEIQILDNYESKTYCTGQAGSIYALYPPLVNACLPPEKWTTYELLFDGPVYQGKKLMSPPRLTAIHNGVVIHHDVIIWGQFQWRDKWLNRPHGPEQISFQNHGNPVRFRSIRVEPRPPEGDETMRRVDMARYMYQLTHQKWVMRADDQPQPKIVTPGATPGAKPSDAAAMSASAFGSSHGAKTTRREYPNSQMHIEWKAPSACGFSAFGEELKLPTKGAEWNSTDFIFSQGANGGTPYVILTAFHNGRFHQKRSSKKVPETTAVKIAGRALIRNMWVRGLGIYPGHDADRPFLTKYKPLFEKSQR